MTDDRKTYLGGPGAAAVLGVNPYTTAVAEWLRLTGRAEPVEMTDQMRSGQRLERAVLDYAAEELKTPVIPGPFIRDVALPLGGHLDGIAEATHDIVEAKTSRTRTGWGEPGTAEVPPHIACQALHYLGLLPEARVCWVPVLFGGLEFQMFRVERDDQLIEQIRNVVWRWWQDYILTDTPPPPVNGADASALFKCDSGAIVIADDSTVEAVARLRDVRREIDLLDCEKEQLEGRIKLALGEASVLSDGSETLATWKASKSSRFDSSAFKAAQPDIYKQFCREQTSRRFLLKSLGE